MVNPKEGFLEKLYLNTGISPDHFDLLIRRLLPLTKNIYNKLKNFENGKFYLSKIEPHNLKNLEEILYNKKHKFVERSLKRILNNFKDYLIEIKNYCLEKEQIYKNEYDKIRFVASIKTKVFKELNTYFKKIWFLFENLPQNKLIDHKIYYQKEMVPIFGEDVFNEFVYLKPLGYTGDFIVSGYIYDNNYAGDNIFTKLIHRYSLSVPMAQAHYYRKFYLKNILEHCLKTKNDPRIISLGCGPAREIIDYFQENEYLPRKHEVYCFDFEKLAINSLKRKMKNLEKKMKKNINLNYKIGNILEFVESNNWYKALGKFDLVYMTGVLDYFSDKVASYIIKKVFSSLVKSKGKFILITVSEDTVSRAYYELLGDWKLYHRNKNNLISLYKDIDSLKELRIAPCIKTKKNLYSTLNKN